MNNTDLTLPKHNAPADFVRACQESGILFDSVWVEEEKQCLLYVTQLHNSPVPDEVNDWIQSNHSRLMEYLPPLYPLLDPVKEQRLLSGLEPIVLDTDPFNFPAATLS
jgi:hypothetical protein